MYEQSHMNGLKSTNHKDPLSIKKLKWIFIKVTPQFFKELGKSLQEKKTIVNAPVFQFFLFFSQLQLFFSL